MTRRLLNLLTALSLLLCVAVTALCVRSFWVEDRYAFGTFGPHGKWFVASRLGRLTAGAQPWNAETGWEARSVDNPYFGDPIVRWAVPGLGVVRAPYHYQDHHYPGPRRPPALAQMIVAHDLLLLLVTATLPGAWLARRVRSRRCRSLGLCPACRYDLRATPDRCPECGTIPAAPPVA